MFHPAFSYLQGCCLHKFCRITAMSKSSYHSKKNYKKLFSNEQYYIGSNLYSLEATKLNLYFPLCKKTLVHVCTFLPTICKEMFLHFKVVGVK